MAQTPEEKRAYMAQWRANNKEHTRQYNHDYGKAHRPEIRAQDAKRFAAHPEIKRAKGARHRAKNRIHIRIGDRERHAANPERRRSYDRKRLQTPQRKAQVRSNKAAWRAKKANAPINDFSTAQWHEVIVAFHSCCAYCGRRMKRLTQDHITPLEKGGSHTLRNIVPACQSCNSKKGTGPPLCPVQPLLSTIAKPRKDTGALARARALAA